MITKYLEISIYSWVVFLIDLQGEQFAYHEDWGETLVGKSRPVLCVLDIEGNNITVLEGVPENISPGQVGKECSTALRDCAALALTCMLVSLFHSVTISAGILGSGRHRCGVCRLVSWALQTWSQVLSQQEVICTRTQQCVHLHLAILSLVRLNNIYNSSIFSIRSFLFYVDLTGGKCGKYECLSCNLSHKVLNTKHDYVSRHNWVSRCSHIFLLWCRSEQLSSGDNAVYSPRLSPDHCRIIYLECSVYGPHMQCSRICMVRIRNYTFLFQQSASGTPSFDLRTLWFQYDWYTKKTTVVVDVVNRSAEGDKYLLLYIMTALFYLAHVKSVFTCVVWQVALPVSTALCYPPSAGQLTVTVS